MEGEAYLSVAYFFQINGGCRKQKGGLQEAKAFIVDKVNYILNT